MTVEEIFARLASHMRSGIYFHEEIARAYDFLGLYGFSKVHIYHQLEETKGYECLLHHYSIHYHKLLTIEDARKFDIIPSTWYKYTTMDVDTGTKRQAVKDLMKRWIEWEQETKKLYEEMYKELFNLNEIVSADKIKVYIKDVDNELIHAEKKLIKLETIDYSIGTIIGWQQTMYNKYKKKIGW